MKKILVIDDDMTFVAVMRAKLDPKRYSVASAGNGEEGLKEIAGSPPDLILLDIMMPKMNGMEFLKKLNETYGKGKIPVIITTNLSSLEEISEGMSLGIRGYFIKSEESLKSIVGIIESVFKE